MKHTQSELKQKLAVEILDVANRTVKLRNIVAQVRESDALVASGSSPTGRVRPEITTAKTAIIVRGAKLKLRAAQQ